MQDTALRTRAVIVNSPPLDGRTYDKTRQVLDLAATITPELLPALLNESDRPEERSQDNGVAGAGFEPATFGL